jgi:hypothetical protein
MTAHPALGERWFSVTASTGEVPAMLFCENETNNALLFGSTNASATAKDGINDYVVGGDAGAVSTTAGSKAAAHVRARLAAGETLTVTVRFAPTELTPMPYWLSVRRKRTRSTTRSPHPTSRPTSGSYNVRPSPDCCGASSSTDTVCGVGCKAIPASPRLRASAGRAVTATGSTWCSVM